MLRPGAVKIVSKQNNDNYPQAKAPVREKIVLWRNKVSSGGSSQKNYMPFDTELKNSVITGIRVYPSGEGVTTPWVDGVAVADYATLAYLFMTLVDPDNKPILDSYPVATLVHSNTYNRIEHPSFRMRIIPEKCWLTIPFALGWGADTYVTFVFTYHPFY